METRWFAKSQPLSRSAQILNNYNREGENEYYEDQRTE